MYIKGTSELKVRRLRLGLTRKEVAYRFEVSPTAIGMWELNGKPVEKVKRLEAYYKELEK